MNNLHTALWFQITKNNPLQKFEQFHLAHK